MTNNLTIATLENMTEQLDFGFCSSCIDSIYINESLYSLIGKTDIVINFKSGRQYAYYKVTFIDIVRLVNAKSVGKTYNAIIKGRYECERVDC